MLKSKQTITDLLRSELVDSILKNLKNQVIVSVQAMPEEPLYDKQCMTAMMKSVINGGARVLRVAGSRDVEIAKSLNVTVIGLTKPDKLPDNWRSIVYITPALEDVCRLAEAGADIIAFDGTSRDRNGCTLKDIIDKVHELGKVAMADISTFEEGINCSKLGADIISTTLSGYTDESGLPSEGPDFELVQNLKNSLDVPIVLEGRIWTPSDVKKAFDMGAYAAVIGSAITRPQVITKRFMEYKNA